MTDLFRTVLNMSITGAYIAAAIIILRLVMKKLPKKYSYMLWAILGIRLLCPFSFSSAVSVFNVLVPEKPEISSGQMEYIPRDIEYSYEPKVTVSVPPVNDTVNTYLPPAEPHNSVNPMQIVMGICTAVWVAGMAAMVIYTVVSYISVRKRVKGAREQGGVFICENIETPFVFGIIRPRIYIPENIPEEDMGYIIAHEQTHIRRGDHIVKLISMAVLCVHWFNPMVWISYRLMTKDMELSCDEKALGTFDTDVKKAYANALLNISMCQNKLTLGGVLSFGESDIKSRIKGVLGAKKPKVIVTIIAVIAVIIAAVCLLTNAVKKTTPEFEPIPDGVYVTDKLLYTAPQKDSYWGDNNGMRYSIKDGTLTMSGTLILDVEITYKLSEPMEIPFSDEEWDKAFDNYETIGWQDGEKNLSDYDSKYCFALQSDEDGGLELYLFVMDDELWYVTYGWEIYRLKQMNISPVDAAREYLNGKNVTDENISELTVAQDSFYNEGWKYTLPPLSLKYGVNDGDNVIEVRAEYTIDGKEVSTLIITSSNETGFRVLDEVNYLLREFTAVISEVHGKEGATGYEWQKYVIIPDEDSYGFTKGEAALVFSRPDYGNDFLNVGDNVKVEYSGEPVTSFTFIGYEQTAYYFLHLTSLKEDMAVETQSTEKQHYDSSMTDNEYSADSTAAEQAFLPQTLFRQESVPNEIGDFTFRADSDVVCVEFMVPRNWTGDGYGLFEHNGNRVMSTYTVYPDSYGLVTEGFKTDMVMGREIGIIDEIIGDDIVWSYYIHTKINVNDVDIETHHFIVHRKEHYAIFSFDDNEEFDMETAEYILSTVSVSPLQTNIRLSDMQEISINVPIGTLRADGTIFTAQTQETAELSMLMPSEWITNGIAGNYYGKGIVTCQGVFSASEKEVYRETNTYEGLLKPMLSGNVHIIGETYAAEGGNADFDYICHKEEYGTECYDYLITRGELCAVIRFIADPSSTEAVRNAIIKSIKLKTAEISEEELSGIVLSSDYNRELSRLTVHVTNNTDKEYNISTDSIEYYDDGEYTEEGVGFKPKDIREELIIPAGESSEFYETITDPPAGKYRIKTSGYFTEDYPVNGTIYLEFDIR